MVERQPHPSNRTGPIRPSDGFILARLSDEDGDYDVAPAEGKSLAQIRFETEPPNLADDDEEQPFSANDPPPRFSVLELLIFVAFAAVGLSAVRWLPAGYFAGVAGIVAFVALLVGGARKPHNAVARLFIWGIVTVYFFAALGTAVLHWKSEAKDAGPPDIRRPSTGQPLK